MCIINTNSFTVPAGEPIPSSGRNGVNVRPRLVSPVRTVALYIRPRPVDRPDTHTCPVPLSRRPSFCFHHETGSCSEPDLLEPGDGAVFSRLHLPDVGWTGSGPTTPTAHVQELRTTRTLSTKMNFKYWQGYDMGGVSVHLSPLLYGDTFSVSETD